MATGGRPRTSVTRRCTSVPPDLPAARGGGDLEEAPMADVLLFFQDAAFDDDATQVMGKAFDRACQSLHDNGQPDLVRQIIAKRIIEVARKGERDPDHYCARP